MSLARLGFVPVLGLFPLFAFGCSDPVPPLPRGAISLHYNSPSFQKCALNSHYAKIGSISEASFDKVVVDGEGGAAIDCSVTGNGPFAVSASASGTTEGKSYSFSMTIGSIRGSATEMEPATGSVAYSSTQTSLEVSSSASDEPCIFYFNADAGQTIATGKIWVTFQCPKMLLDTKVCEIDTGYAVFENCETD